MRLRVSACVCVYVYVCFALELSLLFIASWPFVIVMLHACICSGISLTLSVINSSCILLFDFAVSLCLVHCSSKKTLTEDETKEKCSTTDAEWEERTKTLQLDIEAANMFVSILRYSVHFALPCFADLS